MSQILDHDGYEALSPASPFFSAEGNKMLSKKCHIMMCAVMFSMNGP